MGTRVGPFTPTNAIAFAKRLHPPSHRTPSKKHSQVSLHPCDCEQQEVMAARRVCRPCIAYRVCEHWRMTCKRKTWHLSQSSEWNLVLRPSCKGNWKLASKHSQLDRCSSREICRRLLAGLLVWCQVRRTESTRLVASRVSECTRCSLSLVLSCPVRLSSSCGCSCRSESRSGALFVLRDWRIV
jgi:hypothetical protein